MSYTNIYASGFKYAFDLDYEVQDITMKILVERGYIEYDCVLLGKHTTKGILCFGGGQPASAVSVVLISMYSAIRRNSSANLK